MLPFLFLLAACGCRSDSTQYWQTEEAWYTNTTAPNDSFIDVFYIASTDVIQSFESDGNETYSATLTPEEKSAIKAELDYVSSHFYPDSVNLFAPYYHQYTMNSIYLPQQQFDSVAAKVAVEVCEAFDYYMENYNGGRRFIIAGFSQGGQMAIALLKHMTDEQYSRMVAAYSIGYGISAADLQCSHIKPAQSATDIGVTISFNTVSDPSKMWRFVQNDAAVCINPVNWSCTSEPAAFTYSGMELSAVLDSANNIIVVKGFQEEPLPFTAPWPNGNLHHYDLLFYAPMIRQNTLQRSK